MLSPCCNRTLQTCQMNNRVRPCRERENNIVKSGAVTSVWYILRPSIPTRSNILLRKCTFSIDYRGNVQGASWTESIQETEMPYLQHLGTLTMNTMKLKKQKSQIIPPLQLKANSNMIQFHIKSCGYQELEKGKYSS